MGTHVDPPEDPTRVDPGLNLVGPTAPGAMKRCNDWESGGTGWWGPVPKVKQF